jgi:hypothetical protein
MLTINCFQNTDKSGLASFQIESRDSITFFALVEHSSRLHISAPTYYYQYGHGETTQYVSQLIFDRGFYSNGEIVHLKGYLRTSDGKTVSSEGIAGDGYHLSIEWRGYEFPATIYPVTVSKMGTFNVSLAVPENARYGRSCFVLKILRIRRCTSSPLPI